MAHQQKEILTNNHLQGVPPKGKSHQFELTNHVEIVHMCVVCGLQTKVIWRYNGECFGYMDLFQDFKGAPLMTVERPDLDELRKQWAAERNNGSTSNLGAATKRGKKLGK